MFSSIEYGLATSKANRLIESYCYIVSNYYFNRYSIQIKCIECNRHLKFDRLSERARLLGFDAVATGHHAQITRDAESTFRLTRGHDELKDKSYVVYMLDQTELAFTMFPVGHLTKA